ncbi:mono-ADP-ribosyltransferase C3 [Clostridium botulinum C str. Eklund]|nr:mono-ADP-ribosyltransferase C3 [Clostridium botulinum C str. Eklund]
MKGIRKSILCLVLSAGVIAPVTTSIVQSPQKCYACTFDKGSYADTFTEFTNVEEAKKWGNAQYKKYGLSKPEQEAIKFYTRDASKINGPLRANQGNENGLSSDILQKVKLIDQSFSKMKIPQNIILFRGDDPAYLGPEFQDKILNKDGTINRDVFEQVKAKFLKKDRTEYGYISTSLMSAQFGGRPIVTKFKVTNGSKGGYIDPISYFPGQLEVLLPRNNSYYISDMQISRNNRQIMITAMIFK